jgi:tetratricopeptide (TPR) repeat protein
MSAIFGLFNLLALLYIFRGAQVVWRIIREWQTLKQEPLSREKKSLAEQASFFLVVPPSVALHEFCHALATWLVGGRIVDFGYGGFWGYVVPVGNFTPPQEWFIAIAGTIGNLLFGTAVYLLLRHHPASSFRYFGLRAFRFQLYFALVYYPIFTIFVPTISDWRMIYNFSATPILSGLTLLAQITILYYFYRADRRGWFEMAGFETVTEQAQFATLEQQAAQNPQEPHAVMSLIEGLRRGGAMHKATAALKRYLQTHPDDAEAYALLAAFQMNNKEHVSNESLASAQKALQLGVANPRRRATAYRILGAYALERNQYEEAVKQFSEGIGAMTAVQETENQGYQAYLYHLRSQAYRRQNQYELAYQDVQQAIQLALANGDEKQAAVYQQELDIIETHAGRPLIPSDASVRNEK